MPTYIFRNIETAEITQTFMSIKELDGYIEANPHLQQVPTAPAIVDPVNIGITKPPSDFQKGIIGRMKESIPGVNKDALEKRWTIPREI